MYGSWPYADDWTANPSDIDEDIAACGYDVLTAHRPAPINVVLDPAVPATTPSYVSCEPAATRHFCASTGFVPMATADGGVLLRLNGLDTLDPEVVWIEVVQVDGDTLGARVFARVLPDLAVGAACESALTERLRFTGTLTLSSADFSDPSALHGRADLVLNGGAATVLF